MTFRHLAGLLPLLLPVHAAILFEDTFERTDSRNTQAVSDGVTDNTGSGLTPGNYYSHPYLDPANAAPTFGVQDGVANNGGGAQITGGALELAVGAGTSNAVVGHNFTNAAILAAGGFSITTEVGGYAQSTVNQGGAFGIGMTAAEAASMRDSVGNGTGQPHLCHGFVNGFVNTGPAVSDFWFAIRGNATLAWGTGTTVLGTAPTTQKTGRMSANFRFPDFNAGTLVEFEVIFDGLLVGTGSFAWTDTDANFIGLDARDSTGVRFEDLRVSTDFETAVSYPPVASAFAVTTRPGTDDRRFHWRVTEGTVGDPVTITIRNGTTVVHTDFALSGFADVPTGGGSAFTLTATNAAGESEVLEATVLADDAFATAVRQDSPVAWFRFNESPGSALAADSAPNDVPHDSTAFGGAATGAFGPRDGVATFSGAGAYFLSDFILNPAQTTSGHTIEAVVRRYPGSQVNAAIVSQGDGTGGVGRSHLAVDNTGSIRTFLGGGPAQRKDADAPLPADTWAHIALVVDTTVPEMRFYMDGQLIGTTADGVNPDGSVFDPAFVLESTTGNWRIGTQKLADQNFWLGEMDEVVVYDQPLPAARVSAHASAWLSSASGLLGFYSGSGSVAPGQGTTLTVKVGADVTSVTVDPGIGAVMPVDGVVSIPVTPESTTTYTVTVTGPSGTQVQEVTVTVTSPSVPPVITSGAVVEGGFRITFTGSPFTTYLVRGSLDLRSFAIDHGTASTDASGTGEIVVPLAAGESSHFYRLEESP